jgi:GAF domain-containing protein
MFSGLGPGLGLIVAGLVVIILIWILLRFFSGTKEGTSVHASSLIPKGALETKDAVLIIESGGRVEYLNSSARTLFNLREDEHGDMERLARLTRPANDFLALCAREGQKRLSVGTQFLEASSYRVPGLTPIMLVTLRSLDFAPVLADGESTVSGSILRVLSDFSQAITANLRLPETLHAILENVGRLIPADVLEIKIWDEANQRLIPYRYEGNTSSSEKMHRVYQSRFDSFSNQILENNKLLFLPSVAPDNNEIGIESTRPYPIRSYLGVPLLASDKLVGILEAGQTLADKFSQNDVDLLQLISGQAAVAVRNAILYEEKEKHAAELSGLANLAMAVGVSLDFRELFDRLVKSIAPLFDVDIIGFLLYNENDHSLEGQNPFQGLPPHIVEMYRTSVANNEIESAIVSDPQPLLTLNAAGDHNWQTLGIQNLAQAASLRDSALMPLITNRKLVGFLQLSNHRQGAIAFSEEELRLMKIVATQSSAIIDNALQVSESRQRVNRSEVLRKISELSVSSDGLDEILHSAVQELGIHFKTDTAAIFLMDEKNGELRLHQDSLFGAEPNVVEPLSRLYVSDSQFRLTVTGSQTPFISGQLSRDTRVLEVYRPIVNTLRMESALVVPISVREHCLGELMLGSQKPEFFNSFDLEVVATAAGQLATTIETAHLINQTDEDLRARVDQLTAVMRISRELNASLDLKQLLEVVHDESLRTTNADCGTILLFESAHEAGKEYSVDLALGCPADESLKSFLQQVEKTESPLIVNDFETSEYSVPHDGVRSALFVPIMQNGEIAGVIYLHSAHPDFFSDEIVELIQTMAVQAAIAINSATRYQAEKSLASSMHRRAQSMSSLTEISRGINLDQSLEQQLLMISNGISEATPFQAILFSVYEKDTNMLQRLVGTGFPEEMLRELTSRKQSLASVQQLLRPEFRISQSYFIPAERTPVLPADLHIVTLDDREPDQIENAWNPDDILLVLLEDAVGNPLGLISLDAPRDGLRPDKATIETIEIFATQAAFVINNAMRVGELRTRVETLTSGLQRQQRLLSVTQNDLPLLLHKDLEQTISIHDLERRAERTRAGLAITESVSHQLDPSSALLALGREILTQLGMAVALIAEETLDGPRLLRVLGSVPRGTNPESLFGQRNPLRTCLQTGETILSTNVDDTEEWRDIPLLNGLGGKAFICMPVTVERKVIAAIMAVSTDPLPPFSEEDRQVYFQVARQSSIILENLTLLNETRRRLQEVNLLLDFSRQISGLDHIQIVSALLESSLRVIQAAHAGVVLLWDEGTAQLSPQKASGYADNNSLMKITYASGEALPGMVFENRTSQRVDELNFALAYALSPENLSLFRQATGGRLPVSSLVIPILTSEQSLGVLVLDNFNTQGAFTQEDENLLLSLLQQVALSLENVRLVHSSQERAGQLQALNELATSMTSSLQSSELVSSLLEQLLPVLSFDTATLLLRDKQQLEVAAASGFADSEQRIGLTVAVADSALFQEMIRAGQPISVGDVRGDARFPQIEAPRLSWLGIPLISKGEVIGVIALEKWQAKYYTQEQVQVATTFAGQAAVALENARLYEESLNRAAELDQRSKRLALLNRFSSQMSGLLEADQILKVAAEELQKEFGALRVSAVTIEGETAAWVISSPKTRSKLPKILPNAPVFTRLKESLGVISTEDFLAEPDFAPLVPMLGSETTGLLALPLVGGGILRSILFIQLPENARLTPAEVELSLTIANQAAIALESARLYQEAQRRAQETTALAEVGRDISATLDLEVVLERIVAYAKDLMQAETSAVYIPQEDSKHLHGIAVIGQDADEIKNSPLVIGEGILGAIAQKKAGEIINNAEEDSRAKVIEGTKQASHEHLMSVPILSKNRLSGLMAVWRTGEGLEFSSTELDFLTSLAQHTAIAIENARLFAETQRLAEELEQRVVERTAELQREKANTETLLRILTEVSASLDLDRALSRTLALLNEAVGAEQGTIMLLHAEDNALHYRAGYGYLTGKTPADGGGFTLKVGEGLAGWVVESREAALIEDLHEDSRWVKSGKTSSEHRSSIVAPLLVGEDVIGVLMVFHRKVGFFGPERLGLVKAIASQVAIAINNAHLYELIRDQAERLGSMLRKEQEEASRSQAILEAVADGVVVTASDNNISFLNDSATRILELEDGKIVGQSLDAFGGIFGKAASTWKQTINDWSTRPTDYQPGDSYAEQLELEDGRIALVHVAPVILQDDFLGTVSIFRDITHEVEVDRLKSEFVATVSHELRTPMTSIRGYVDILLMGAAGALNENQTHFLQIVKNNTERLNILVDDLLDISRIEAGRVTLSPIALDLRQMAEDVLADVTRRSKDEKKPMVFSLDAEKNIPAVVGDEERVRQMLGNLVDNAYHYTPENGQVTVHIEAMNGSEVQVDVIDSGVGIPVEDQERVFDRFYRGEDPLVLATPGTGLGLAIVRQLVEMHNGRIWLDSEGEGKGSTFSFTLPAYNSDE